MTYQFQKNLVTTSVKLIMLIPASLEVVLVIADLELTTNTISA
ncbi:hypothetical protein QUF74_19255 [Candidatus Halobeggiatoa sp. HSG11]|nr:hypothetical protein [Candidatus Halobeggiatoa sp. HSG11]